jgi:hypothetical protein
VRENVPSVPDGDAVQPIVALGARQYRIGHTRPVVVDEFEDNVLQTFLELRTMDQPTLEDLSGVHHAPKVLKRLREKYGGMFAAAITLPGGRGKGGSHVEITKPA